MAGTKGKSGSGGKRQGSGRQKGVPNKATTDIKAAAQAHGAAMITELVRLATKAESEAARVAACKEILDRAYGKSPQAVTVDPGDTFTDMLKAFMTSIDGNSRGLPKHRAPAASSVSATSDRAH